MRDLVDRDAIMESVTKEYNRRRTGDGLKLAWIEKAVNAVPSAQPKTAKQTNETAQNVPNDDLISRKAAIEIANDIRDRITVEGYWMWMERLKRLPSAPPEIIYCRDCKHYIDGWKHCDRVTWWNSKDDYCSNAERREDAAD